MLQRMRIKGYKSFRDAEVRLEPLSALFGPNAAGKSNFFDALQLFSKLGTGCTVEEAFDAPHRGDPIEAFWLETGDVKSLMKKRRLAFSMEADLRLSDSVVAAADRRILETWRSGGNGVGGRSHAAVPQVRERYLRYRIEVEMRPRSGALRVADECLVALGKNGRPIGRRKPFIERKGDKIHLHLEGRARSTGYDRHLDHTVLSMPHYPQCYPHLTAVRRELEGWKFFCFEPRERMRAPNFTRETRQIGLSGEKLTAFLRTLRAEHPKRFKAIENALHMVLPNVDGIELEINDRGAIELRLRENRASFSARVLSEGTLRLLGLLALDGVGDAAPSLVGVERPENSAHPSRIQLIAELLRNRTRYGDSQYIVTTHSLALADMLPQDCLFPVRSIKRQTRVDPLGSWGPLFWRGEGAARAPADPDPLPVSERILRGDFDA